MSGTTYLALIGALLLLSFQQRKSQSLEKTIRLTPSSSQELKGLAILLVILSHLNVIQFIQVPEIFVFSGAWGVAIFLFLSGYGLAQSYLVKGLNYNFISKRLSKVWVPYVIASVLWILIDFYVLSIQYSWKQIVLTLLGIDLTCAIDQSMWFITYIMLWYMAFFLCFKLPIPDMLKVIPLFGIAFLMRYGYRFEWLQYVEYHWALHAYLFPLGSVFGLALPMVQKFMTGRKIPVVLFLAAIISFTCFIGFVGKTETIKWYILSNLSLAFSQLAMFVLLEYYNYSSRLLAFFGGLSFELYLTEFVFMTKYDVLHWTSYQSVALISYFLVIVSLSLLLQKTVSFLFALRGLSTQEKRLSA